MKNINKVFWGIIIIVIGIIFFGNNFNLWNIDIFFDGWWSLFIIIPSIYGLLKKEWISSIMGIAIGTLLLLARQNVIEWNLVGKSFLPFVLIAIGLSFVLNAKNQKITINKKRTNEYIGIFSGNENKITDKFGNSSTVAVFGSVDLDLREAKIENDIQIDAVTVFGEIDIKLPDNVIVKTSGVPIFGGIDNKFTSIKDKKPTVLINYVCIFGGIDIK